MKAGKEEWIEEQWKSIERGMMLGRILSRLSPGANSVSQHVIEDSSGNILTESTAVLNQCTEYC